MHEVIDQLLLLLLLCIAVYMYLNIRYDEIKSDKTTNSTTNTKYIHSTQPNDNTTLDEKRDNVKSGKLDRDDQMTKTITHHL